MTITLGWPQIIVISLPLIGLVLAAKDHGQPRQPQSFWAHLIAVALTYALLIWGGFFG